MRGRQGRIADVVELNPPFPHYVRGSASSREVPFLPMAAVSEDGIPEYGARRQLAEVVKGYTCFGRGDVLLAKITPCFENGKAADLSDLPDDVGFGSTEFHVLRPGSEIDGRYLFHFLRSARFRSGAAEKMTGSAGQRRVPAAVVGGWRIPLPPLPEQRRIAAILDKADAIRRKRQESLALLDALLRSTFLVMFGDPVRNERGWEVVRLGEVAEVTTGNTPPRNNERFYGGDIDWVKSDNIGMEGPWVSRSAERLSVEGARVGRVVGPGSVLAICIAGSRSSIGRVGITDTTVAFNQQINALTPREGVDHRYLFGALRVGQRLVQAASTDSMKGLVTKGRFERIWIPLPPKRLQHAFGAIFNGWVGVSAQARTSIRAATHLFQSLSQRAFQGDLSG